MNNFDLKKYLAEGKLLKENKYDIDDPNSPLGQLNDNDQDVAILNNMTKKYGKDVVLMWMSSGEYGDREYFEEGKLFEEEVDVNKILSDGGYDIIDDEELLMTVKSRLKGNSNIDAEKLNLFVMKIEDEEGGNIDFAENKLLKENQLMGKYIKTKHPDGYDMIMSFSMPDEGELGLDYGTLDEILEVKEINGVKVYCVYI